MIDDQMKVEMPLLHCWQSRSDENGEARSGTWRSEFLKVSEGFDDSDADLADLS